MQCMRRPHVHRVPTPDRRIAGLLKRLSPFRRFFVEVHA